jgi:MurNAc alpha-1-phosphate uridylyltransferase
MTGNATAMLLAAGRGQRLRPLTDRTPKPLLKVRGKPLAHWLLESLLRAGCRDVVMNTAWLGHQLLEHFGERPMMAGLEGLRIAYSHEGEDFGRALETAGGIARALPLLGDVFWVCAADIFAPQFGFSAASKARFEASGKLAHLWLVPNQPQHPNGDFALAADGLVHSSEGPEAPQRYTFSTIGLYRAAFFTDLPAGNPQGLVAPLAPMLRRAMDNAQVTGELYPGFWADAGTPDRLAALDGGPETTSAQPITASPP